MLIGFEGPGVEEPARLSTPVPDNIRSSKGGGSADHCSSGSSKERAYCHPSFTSTRGCVKSSVQSDLEVVVSRYELIPRANLTAKNDFSLQCRP
jgi:hypothetical protein